MRRNKQQNAAFMIDVFDFLNIAFSIVIFFSFFITENYYLLVIAIGIGLSIFATRVIGILNSILAIVVILFVSLDYYTMDGLNVNSILGIGLLITGIIIFLGSDFFSLNSRPIKAIMIFGSIISVGFIIASAYFLGSMSNIWLFLSFLLTSIILMNSLAIISIFMTLKFKSKSFLQKGV